MIKQKCCFGGFKHPLTPCFLLLWLYWYDIFFLLLFLYYFLSIEANEWAKLQWVFIFLKIFNDFWFLKWIWYPFKVKQPIANFGKLKTIYEIEKSLTYIIQVSFMNVWICDLFKWMSLIYIPFIHIIFVSEASVGVN